MLLRQTPTPCILTAAQAARMNCSADLQIRQLDLPSAKLDFVFSLLSRLLDQVVVFASYVNITTHTSASYSLLS